MPSFSIAFLILTITSAWVSSASHSAAAETVAELKQAKAALTTVFERMHRESWGELAKHSGIYDQNKNCSTEIMEPVIESHIGTALDHVNVIGLLARRFIWFEGDRMYFISMMAPNNIGDGSRVTFANKEIMYGTDMVRLYRNSGKGEDEIIGLSDTKFVTGLEADGDGSKTLFLNRCENEYQLLAWAKAVYDRRIWRAAGAKGPVPTANLEPGPIRLNKAEILSFICEDERLARSSQCMNR